MIEDAEPWEMFSQDMRTARKPHRCDECGRTIQPGERYEHVVGKLYGDFERNDTCAHCCEARKWLQRECGGYCFTGVEEDLYDHWHEEKIRTKELARLLWGIRRDWTTRRGELMALPEIAA